MKLINAKFENFRLLRDLEIDFSTSHDKKLTVLRAENESGKTTILNALQWALYGHDSLPNKGSGYRLSPIDWNIESNGNRVPVSVTVTFETFGGKRREARRYKIVRSVDEILNGARHEIRSLPQLKLYILKDEGADLIEHPESTIKNELPDELREVFFTDGDRTLDFIAANENKGGIRNRRERVRMAIRSLLELEIIESALKHVEKTTQETNRMARGINEDTDLNKTLSDLEKVEAEIDELEKRKYQAESARIDFDAKLNEIDKQIEIALQHGDKFQLKKDIQDTKHQREILNKELNISKKEHSNLLRKTVLSRDLLADTIEKSLKKLDSLRDQGKFPNTAIPILTERLKDGICICGESLANDNQDANHRRIYIERKIEESKKSDALQTAMTELYYGSQQLQPGSDDAENNWSKSYLEIADKREKIRESEKSLGVKQRSLEATLGKIPDTNIVALRENKEEYKRLRNENSDDFIKAETRMEGLRTEKSDLEFKRDKLLRKREKGSRILANLEVANDIKTVLNKAYNRITDEELSKVSSRMNDIFLEMIGADPEQGATIKKSEINKDFDIVVYGADERKLDPDSDLNGASRRALTLSFILALTKVSEVEAPNVIDTPLGMMSGYVKTSVLTKAIKESSQLILFLTRSEITDCENIIKNKAGKIITLTNSTHYPRMLKNDPKSLEGKIIRCSCDSLKECDICERHNILPTNEDTSDE